MPRSVRPWPAPEVPERNSGYSSRRLVRDRGPDDQGGRIQLKRQKNQLNY